MSGTGTSWRRHNDDLSGGNTGKTFLTNREWAAAGKARDSSLTA